MKMKWSFLSAVMAIILLLSACGAKESGKVNSGSNNNEDVPTEDIEVNEDEELTEDSSKEDETEVDVDAEENQTEADQAEATEPSSEKSETTDTPAEETVASDNQDFSIKLLPNYELSSEEPGQDIVYTAEDDSRFLRIETMENEEGNYDYLKDNMLVVLEASSNGETPTELTDESSIPASSSIKNAVAYTVTSDNGPVTGMIFENGDLIVRLTIFDSENNDYFEDFLKMGETVTQK